MSGLTCACMHVGCVYGWEVCVLGGVVCVEGGRLVMCVWGGEGGVGGLRCGCGITCLESCGSGLVTLNVRIGFSVTQAVFGLCEKNPRSITVCVHAANTLTVRSVSQADGVCGQDLAPGSLRRVGATAVHPRGAAEQAHPVHLLPAEPDHRRLHSRRTRLRLQNGGSKLKRVKKKSAPCFKNILFGSNDEW